MDKACPEMYQLSVDISNSPPSVLPRNTGEMHLGDGNLAKPGALSGGDFVCSLFTELDETLVKAEVARSVLKSGICLAMGV